ncbi:endo-1,4-beta-xylanase [Roseomonas gilardii subsp. gilardii]|uniref:endo-1,4-beta-xylanase n=1 Tax=Roseomonas gilardii TaxID=257708 RepID=UPI001FF92FA2|nr:endo-1,4-beta-xylanase [Roseomonas gilardii]UPG72782.1 endo-1,4-beta-xylanase [Roseomonas gilardii subsp. gilardii]
MDLLHRRRLIAAALAGAGVAAMPAGTPRAQPAGPGLGEIARSRGYGYGAAAQSAMLRDNPDYARAYRTECALLVPEYEGKWGTVQPQEGKFDFGPLDGMGAWARREGKVMRGHALIWHHAMPDWLGKALGEGPQRARAVMEAHFTAVLEHTREGIRDWDVVNEVIADPPGSDTPQGAGDLRDTPWLRALGPSYIELALRLARERDPTLRITLNEYGVEEEAPHCLEKRRRLLALVRQLRRAGAPLDAVGMQAHLQMDRPFSGPSFTAFCKELAGEGLQLLITELDVRESWKVPDGYPARDALVAARVKEFAEAALAGGVKTILTWGLIDRYSWLVSDPGVARKDGLKHRGLPLDWEGSRKPFWNALAEAFQER